MKVAVATPHYPKNLEDGLNQIAALAKEAAQQQAAIICFPESYLPGYPIDETHIKSYSPQELENAFNKVRTIASENNINIILPTDWYESDRIYNVAHVISKTGEHLGYQTKNQLDPTEDNIWNAGTERHLFKIDELKFGISICHEGFRYPETVRWAARRGAQIVFHPFYAGSNTEGILPQEWAQKNAPYYEKAQMARALENTVYIATSNYAFQYPEAASSVIAPDGNCIAYQPYGSSGVLVADIDIDKATGLLAKRLKAELY